MSWIYLLIAAVFEMGWALLLKSTDGFTKLWPSVITGTFLVASMAFLALAVRQLPIGTAYAIWTGLGAAGTVIVGMIFLGEPVNPLRVASLILILTGLIGLKVAS